tara:strand:- start:100 stop:534 length:435 start_codon:yes stop_codon:yes gene_type:complete
MSVNDDDIKILMEQTDIDKEMAKKLLIHNKGDLVESIIQIHNNKIPDFNSKKEFNEEKDILEEEHIVNVTNSENLKEYRKIVDEKDTIYNFKSNQKEKQKILQKQIEELKEQGKEYEHLLEKKPDNEELYYMAMKGSLNSILVL